MPSLLYYGKRLLLGGDDLVLPSGIDVISTGSWLVVVMNILKRNGQVLWSAGWFGFGLLTGSVALAVSRILNQLAIINVSLRGTLVNTYPRQSLKLLLWVRTLLDGLQLTAIVLFGTTWTFIDKASLPLNIIFGGCTIIKCGVVYVLINCIGSRFLFRQKPKEKVSRSNSVVIRDKWTNRLSLFAKLFGGTQSSEMQSLADLLTNFEKSDHDANLAPSDILAALLLLRSHQSHRKLAAEEEAATCSGSRIKMKSWMTKKNMQHFMKFAAAAYGWPMNSRFSIIIGDTSNLSNTQIIKRVTLLPDENLVFVSFYNKLFEVPFFVAIDDETKSVVVSIRGTESIEDIFTDVVAYASDPLDLKHINNARVHNGMHRTAEFVYALLVDGGDSTKISQFKNVPALLPHTAQVLKDRGLDGYKVVVTGHSLGAGVAAILTLMLRDLPQYADVRCFAFSPPGGLVDIETAAYADSFVLSVVVGDDVIGRLSLQNIYDVKVELLKIIRDCDIPKHKIFGGWFLNLLRKLFGPSTPEIRPSSQRRHSWDDGPLDEVTEVLQFKAEVNVAIAKTKMEKSKLPSLYIPGRVCYINVENSRESQMHNVDGNSAIFKELFISSTMLRDHMPWFVLKVLQN